MAAKNHPSSAVQTEKKALRLSLIGSALMALLGIGFTLFTGSIAVLLDALFSSFGFVIALLALGVSRLVQRPDDRFHQFGYGAFESFFNFTKGLLIAAVSLIALVTSVLSIMQGGRPVSTGFVALYSFLIGIICFVIAIIQSGMSRRLHSLLVKVDARNWLIDGIISVGIAAGFLIAALLNRTKLDWMVAYADPVIVILIVLGTASLPIHIIGSSLKQLLLAAPKEALQGKAEAVIESTLADFPVAAKRLRMVEVGRYVYMLLTVVIPENESGMGIGKTDTMRSKIYTSVTDAIPNSDIDVYFTTDRRWID